MPERITSPQNPRLKRAARLRDRKGRESQERIIIDGARPIRRALEAGVELLELFVCQPTPFHGDDAWVWHRVANSPVTTINLAPEAFSKISYGDRISGMVAVARMPGCRLDSLQVTESALVAVLQNVEKPGNLGAVARTADATGVTAIIAADPATDLYNPNAIRASLGTVFSVSLATGTGRESLKWLRENRFQILAARVEGAVPYTEVDFRQRTAIVLGSEAKGLCDRWRGPDIRAVSLPMLGRADSLNVSVTAAVLFYEALRQRSAA